MVTAMGQPKPSGIYIPAVFRVFQGFDVVDLKEYRIEQRLEIQLEKVTVEQQQSRCHRCGGPLGHMNSRYRLKARHLRMMGWQVEVVFWREKRWCIRCGKYRAEAIEWLCPTSSHATMDLAWWLNRLTEITSVLSVSRLEGLDKKTCYKLDKVILLKLLQGYKIPAITKIAVDEVYARGPRQMKEGETRDDLFMTVVVDLNTHKVIWVSQSRRKQALDEFFKLIGPRACHKIEVVATDQHEGYAASIREHCPQATQVWDRFHLVQKFNEAFNEDRKREYNEIDPEGKNYEEKADLMRGKYKYVFLTKAKNRSKTNQIHFDTVAKVNEKIAKMEIIKEHFHKIFDCTSKQQAQVMMADIYQWSQDAGAWNTWRWIKDIRTQPRFWNYFEHHYTTGPSEGINRVIKGLKWQAYGYKDMQYFALKILQKAGYLNSLFHQQLMPGTYK